MTQHFDIGSFHYLPEIKTLEMVAPWQWGTFPDSVTVTGKHKTIKFSYSKYSSDCLQAEYRNGSETEITVVFLRNKNLDTRAERRP